MKYSEHYIEGCLKNNYSIDKKFVNWINKVEKKIFDKFEWNLLDLPDEAYMLNFENNTTVNDMYNIIINGNLLYLPCEKIEKNIH